MRRNTSLLPSTIRGVNLPVPYADSATLPALPNVTYCVGFDWIEFTALINGNLPDFPFLYSHEHTGHGTQYFVDLYKVDTVVHGETFPFCTLETGPRPSFLDKHLVKVKIDNRFCYTPSIRQMMEHFMREFNLTFLNYTRLDVFLDMQYVNGYGNNVQQLLQDCATRKLVMKGKSMRPHWTRNEVDGITWGSRASGTSITMYNKTKEMLKKSWKPWIEGLWGNAKFDVEGLDVYRLEFSAKKPKTGIEVITDSELIGNIVPLKFTDISLVDELEHLVTYYYETHFQMAVNKEGERFSRMERYSPICVASRKHYPFTFCEKPKSNNYTKSYVKRLAVDALFYQKKGDNMNASFVYDHLLDVIERHSLYKWFHEKFFWLQLKTVPFTDFASHFMQHQKLTQSSLNLN